jgi:hypothetical protein
MVHGYISVAFCRSHLCRSFMQEIEPDPFLLEPDSVTHVIPAQLIVQSAFFRENRLTGTQIINMYNNV